MKFPMHKIHLLAIFTLLSAALTINGCINPQISEVSNDKKRQAEGNPQELENADSLLPSAKLTVKLFNTNEARNPDLLEQVIQGVNDIYQQCRISVLFETQNMELATTQIIDRETRINLAEQYKDGKPSLFYVPRTAELDVAFAYLPSLISPLASSIWITERVSEGCLPWITAHEIGHVLLDSGKHSNGSVNVMSNGCTENNWSDVITPRWTSAQCAVLHQSTYLTRQTEG